MSTGPHGTFIGRESGMAYRCLVPAVAAAVILLATASPRADDIRFQNLGLSLRPPQKAGQDRLHRDGSLPQDPGDYRWAADAEWAAPGVPRPLENRRFPITSGHQDEWPRRTPRAAIWESPARLPGTESFVPPGRTYVEPQRSLPQPVDGTWRNDGRYLILNVNGQELRLLKESQIHAPDGLREEERLTGGTVQGRLSHQGRPLVNCQAGLRPLTKGFTGYQLNRPVQRLRVTTDDRGAYVFRNVPAGPYKLTWLPEGTNQWIRRIAMRPDVVVRDGETVSLKEIRVALKTLN